MIAIEALRGIGATPRPVVVLITADEEIGSPEGRPLVEELARNAAAALVVEPPVREGTITTARSGLARYQLYIQGRSAHAGNGHRGGISAIEELAHQTIALHELADRIEGARINVGQVGGGSGDNVVAAEAWARIDARAWTSRGPAPAGGRDPRAAATAGRSASSTVRGGITRPPMNQSHVAERLAQRAIEIGDGYRPQDRPEHLGRRLGRKLRRRSRESRCWTGLARTGWGLMRSTSAFRSNRSLERIHLLRALLLEL